MICVNEEGTEATAETGVVMTKGMSRPQMFRVDHPFVLLIRENQKGNILFIGRIVDPTK
jgi:serpin B